MLMMGFNHQNVLPFSESAARPFFKSYSGRRGKEDDEDTKCAESSAEKDEAGVDVEEERINKHHMRMVLH